MSTSVTEVGVSTNEINRLFELLGPILQQENVQLVQAALITLLLQNIGPEMTDEELAVGVHDVSTMLILYTERIRLNKNVADLISLNVLPSAQSTVRES